MSTTNTPADPLNVHCFYCRAEAGEACYVRGPVNSGTSWRFHKVRIRDAQRLADKGERRGPTGWVKDDGPPDALKVAHERQQEEHRRNWSTACAQWANDNPNHDGTETEAQREADRREVVAMPNNSREAEIEARLAAATPRPWRAEPHTISTYASVSSYGTSDGERSYVVAKVALCHAGRQDADAALIVHAPEDLRYLLDVVSRCRDLAADFERKAKTLRDLAMAQTARHMHGEASRLADKATTYEAEARALRAALDSST